MSSTSSLNGYGGEESTYSDNNDDIKPELPSIGLEFEGLIRPLINIIDQLRAIGIEKDLGLPTIAVMGDQSSGKSSVLEAISGIPLPRGSDIVTRCPLEMRMEKAPSWSGEVSFAQSNGTDIKWKLNSPKEVPQYIEKATDMLAGRGKGVSDKIISMRIRSPEAPDLTLIDLPGIVHSVENHQSDEVIQCVENLIKKYMMQPRTIMLCLYPACVEIANCVIFRMANQFDPQAKRTIAVITKPDLVVDKDQKLKVCNKIYKGGVYNIKEFYIVRSRTPTELATNLSRSDLLVTEAKFFENDDVFRRIDPDIRGFSSLIKALTKKLVKAIYEDLPGIRNEVSKMLNDSQMEYHQLPKPPPTSDAEKTMFLSTNFYKYITDVKEALHEGEKPCEWEAQSSSSKRVSSSSSTSKPSTMFSVWRKHFDSFLKEIELHTKAKFSSKGDWKEEKLLPYIQSQRGKELSGFPNFNACRNLIISHLEYYQRAASECLQNLYADLRGFIQLYTNGHFSSHPELCDVVMVEAMKTADECLRAAQERIDFFFRMERLAFCQDDTILKLTKIEKELDAAKKALTDRLENQVVPMAVKKMIETLNTDEDFKVMMARQMQDALKIYFQASNQRLGDNIPAAIRVCLHLEFADALCSRMLRASTEPEIMEALSEEDIHQDHRDHLSRKIRRLEEAQKLLKEFKMPSK